MQHNEANTRREFIDRDLSLAGWDIRNPTKVGLEIPVDGAGAEPWNGITDYCLYHTTGEVIAVVEAKRTSRHARVAEEQVRHYVTQIEARQSFRPFSFMTNGLDIYFWDVGVNAPRIVSGFFTAEDLENLLWIRQNKTPPSETLIDSKIVERLYQQEAIRRVEEAFEQGKRRALLVMATGTGKTRTTMALIDLFFRTNLARKVLFLADRDALVQQALEDGFQTFLPDEPRDRIFTDKIDKNKRLYVATLQTIGRCFNSFSHAFFDLIIFDEAHRSIFNRLGEVMDYFDARMVGLTATPANFIDRDTFRLFDCLDNKPTYLYTYRQAVEGKFLVDYSLYQARTRFQRQGIRGVDLSEEERNALIDQGLDPDEIDYSGTEIEKTVSVTGTLEAQWEEFMEVCIKDQSGQLPGKTIVFAMTQAHAQRLREVFEKMFPQFPDLVKVITSDTERVRDGSYGDGLITKFKRDDMPRIAISVDMLDTGIDVPEVVNLVFMKPVHSQIKLWQMIGRGTRNQEACKYFDRLPNGRKTEFKIIDFWENEFDKDAEDVVAQTVPVLVRIFNTRLNILKLYLKNQDSEDCQRVIADLQTQIKQIPLDTFAVRRIYPQIEEAWNDSFWRFISPSSLDFLRTKVGPLMRYVPDVDVAAATFTNKVERLKYQILTGKVQPDTLQSIAEDAHRLADFVHQNIICKPAIELCLSSRLASASAAELSGVIENLAPKMRFKKEHASAFQMLDLPDYIATGGYVSLSESGERVYVTEYRERVERKILEIADNHPAIKAIREGCEASEDQLIELERTLRNKLGAKDIQLSTDNIRKAYGLKVGSLLGFLRHLLELNGLPDYESIVKHRFEQHIAAHNYNADQLRFLGVVQNVFLQTYRLERADLYEGKFESFGMNAVDRFFSEQEVQELLALTEQLAA